MRIESNPLGIQAYRQLAQRAGATQATSHPDPTSTAPTKTPAAESNATPSLREGLGVLLRSQGRLHELRHASASLERAGVLVDQLRSADPSSRADILNKIDDLAADGGSELGIRRTDVLGVNITGADGTSGEALDTALTIISDARHQLDQASHRSQDSIAEQQVRLQNMLSASRASTPDSATALARITRDLVATDPVAAGTAQRSPSVANTVNLLS
jgi:hypothetical protein